MVVYAAKVAWDVLKGFLGAVWRKVSVLYLIGSIELPKEGLAIVLDPLFIALIVILSCPWESLVAETGSARAIFSLKRWK